mmetsp:Transcript_41788/g.65272  ORF Transcript_41788/g.65272 Transcript_41788/m.65272 type:complete len:120 (-) Transcript_41788:320-679(-)
MAQTTVSSRSRAWGFLVCTSYHTDVYQPVGLQVLEDQDHGAIERSTWLQMPDWCETMPQGGNFFLVCECYEPNPKDPSRCSGFETLFDHFGSGSARGCPRCMRNPFLRRLHELDSLLPA